MRNVTGQVVEGDDFFNRVRDLKRFWSAVETDNIMLLAPRRVGKTSILRRMKDQAEDHDFAAVFVDVSDCKDELRFVQRLYTAILEHNHVGERLWNGLQESWLGKTVSRIRKAGGAGFSIEFAGEEVKWDRMGEELADALDRLNRPTLIQVDELPVFALKLLNRTAPDSDQGRIREFLYWLRRLRLEYPRVRWILAGSIGLDTVASRLNIADAINDLRIETLGAFELPASHEFLASLGQTYKLELSEAVKSYLIAKVGWPIPFYLQLVFNKLREVSHTPTEQHVDNAIDALLDPSHKQLFDYWRQRLRDELGRPDSDYATSMLHAASRTPAGVRRSTLRQVLSGVISDAELREDKLRYVLDVLQNDGYLIEDADYWKFRSPLLREYWHRRVAPPESGA